MSLLETSHDRAFSLVELLVVVGLMFVVGMFMFPVGLQFYRMQMLNESSEGLASVLRRAQHFSLTGAYDSTHGVRIVDGGYVLFAGESYDTRDPAQDEQYFIPSVIGITGMQEVTFTPFTGMPNATGTFLIETDVSEARVTVRDSGLITQ